eukprot:2804636-Prymnesium_polylepis.2
MQDGIVRVRIVDTNAASRARCGGKIWTITVTAKLTGRLVVPGGAECDIGCGNSRKVRGIKRIRVSYGCIGHKPPQTMKTPNSRAGARPSVCEA